MKMFYLSDYNSKVYASINAKPKRGGRGTLSTGIYQALDLNGLISTLGEFDKESGPRVGTFFFFARWNQTKSHQHQPNHEPNHINFLKQYWRKRCFRGKYLFSTNNSTTSPSTEERGCHGKYMQGCNNYNNICLKEFLLYMYVKDSEFFFFYEVSFPSCLGNKLDKLSTCKC